MLDKDQQKQEARLALAKRIEIALELSKLDREHVATEIRVTVQAISGWVTTGKIRKDNLSRLADICNVRLSWLLTGEGQPQNHVLKTYPVKDRPVISSKAAKTLEYLHSLASSGVLTDLDFDMLDTVVRRLVVTNRRAQPE